MLDRTSAPPSKTIENLHFPWPQADLLKEGVPLFVLHAGSQPVIKIELVLDAGKRHEPLNGVAYFTAKMLKEGTQHRSAQDIAQYIDQYGASMGVRVQPDTCTITLVTLSKHLEPMLVLLAELLQAPTFDAKRLAHLQHLKTQGLKLEAEKNDYVARKKFQEVLFDSAHPYGRQLTEEAIAYITPAHLKQYYQDQLLSGGCLLVSGQVYDRDLQMIKQYLQPLPIRTRRAAPSLQSTPSPTHMHLPKAESLQAAINVGKVLFAKDHPDYLPLLVVNTLLGGYFGSRLMRNIREDKGYTYGIYSRIISLQHSSYLCIATEVMQDVTQATCQEIHKEIRRLQTVPVPEEELDTLRNYMLGTFTSEINDPFSIMDKFKAAYLYGLDQAYYAQLYDIICHISPAQIRSLARTHLATDSLSQVIVG